jgi:hypothetical protein
MVYILMNSLFLCVLIQLSSFDAWNLVRVLSMLVLDTWHLKFECWSLSWRFVYNLIDMLALACVFG